MTIITVSQIRFAETRKQISRDGRSKQTKGEPMNTQAMIKRLFLSIAISVAALIAGTSTAAAAVTRCDGQLASGTYDTVLVSKGKTCLVDVGVIVEQNVIVQEGASLATANALTVNGNLLGNGVNSVLIIGGGNSIHGNVSITGAKGEVFLDHVTIGGNLNISNSNMGGIAVGASQVTGNALFQNNTTSSFGIVTTVIFGNLVCNGNNPGPELVINTVSGQTIGQCKLP
jgi:hypothetical protein